MNSVLLRVLYDSVV